MRSSATRSAKLGFRHRLAAMDEEEGLADLLQDLEVVARGRVQAYEDELALRAQLAEEVEHEADIAVLCVELRLVEEVQDRLRRRRGREQRRGNALRKRAHLIGLVVVDREPVALLVLDPVDVGAGDEHPAVARSVRAGDHLEQRRLAGPVRPDHADDPAVGELEVGSSVKVGRLTSTPRV